MPDAQPGPASNHRHTVLITRPANDAARTADAVRRLGWTPLPAPLLTIEARPIARPTRLDAVLATSGNALPALAGLEAVPLLTVGDATAARARAAGFATVFSAGGNASDLLALAGRQCRPGASLLLASGAGQGMELLRGLRGAGFRVRRRVAYAARPVAAMPEAALHALAHGELRAALFLSADTARAFVRLLPPALRPFLATVDALAIGPPAAFALTPLPWRRIRVSLTPTLDGLLTLL